MDTKIVHVALNGLENILKVGEKDHGVPNPYAVEIEECYGKALAKKSNIVCQTFEIFSPNTMFDRLAISQCILKI